MTRLHVLGSGSKGNAFVVESEEALLLIEAGFSARELIRRMTDSGLDPDRVVGVALTHEHGDHSRGAVRIAGLLGVPVLASGGTWRRLAGRPDTLVHLRVGFSGHVEIGPFSVAGSPIVHDAAEPMALAVTSRRGVRIGFAFDLGRPTTGVRYLLSGVHAMVIEANYDEGLLRSSGYPASVQARIAGSEGHLSNRVTANLMRELWHPALEAVVLAHLSQNCNAPDRARETVGAALEEVGYAGRLFVASQGEPLPPISLGGATTVSAVF